MRPIDADYILSALGIFNDREHGNEHFIFGIETAKEIVQNAPTVGGWISVKDRLPEYDIVDCLIVDEGYVCFAYHRIKDNKHDFWMNYDDEIETFSNVTHWMPLPEPRQEVEE